MEFNQVAGHPYLEAMIKEHNWKFVLKKFPYMVRIKREEVVMNIYWSGKGVFTKIATLLVHPKRGRNQMFREVNQVSEIEKYLINPRSHGGKGYGSNKNKKGKAK